MRTYKIMLQSASDIITNSSSEIYTIKSGVGEDFLRSWWDAKLKELGYSPKDIADDEFIAGRIYEENGYLVLSYPIMCNISEDIFDILLKRFGAKNVKCEYYG
jgi:hypothetical protein